ncbi:phosphoribosylformylglycinamidine synthase I [Sedimentisphaera salicampi]|uniref:phosphoribosylformylglycinamidine synthase I n=1 Tax=Sedimentisphaera salicampi TaxID=1941349 RepID=UPI000B9C6155|nr:phosphoribosylformylglycinamidine synthase I [Sedimentisphaera salicampi]OXU15810.1 Phosphoribosylformylglycinamidine synthase [Sedimentisphaera salicampi]
MSKIKGLVLRAAGINCDVETQYALELAGFEAERVHINELLKNKSILEENQILVFPGGFSYGDDVAAGRILANQIEHHLFEKVEEFVGAGKLVLGICNGFQVLVKSGLLPTSPQIGCRSVSITHNDIPQFYDNWVYLQPGTEKCVFINPEQRIYLPMAHGEGKVVTKDARTLSTLQKDGHIAFRYVDKDGKTGDYPINPNGAVDSIAGLTDSTGRVLGLMPHPERFIRRIQHPQWTRLPEDIEADGMTIFKNAAEYVQNNL